MISVVQIVNHVPDLVSELALARIADACSTQLVRDFCPAWDLTAIEVEPLDDVAKAATGALVVTLERTSDEAGAAAYHYEKDNGALVAPVFAGDILKYGTLLDGADSVSCAASHEILETLPDPWCTRWEQGTKTAHGDLYAFEVCDPVQGHAYPIASAGVDVSVSNFVTLWWFSMRHGGDGMLDFLGVAPAPFQLAPGGYMVLRGPSGEHPVFGALAPSKRVTDKLRAQLGRNGFRAKYRL